MVKDTPTIQANERQVEKKPFPHIVRKRMQVFAELTRISPPNDLNLLNN